MSANTIKLNDKDIRIVSINNEANLCALVYSVNNGLIVVKDPFYKTNDLNEYGFKIDNPTRFKALLTTVQYKIATEKLMENQKSFMSKFYPLGYLSGQKTPLWELTLEFGYEHPNRIPHVSVLDFGLSYGKLKVDEYEVDLSHIGGSSYDRTDSWNLVGDNKLQVVSHLVHLLTKKIA